MKIIRQPLILAASLAAVLALSACGKQDQSDSNSPVPAGAPPAAEPTAANPASTPGSPTAMTGAPAQVTVNSVELGSTVDADNKILAASTSFAPSDSIYASVSTNGNGNAKLDAKWTYQDGQTVHEDSKTVDATGPQSTSFMISKPGGFPSGNYKVAISLNGEQVASKDFSVK